MSTTEHVETTTEPTLATPEVFPIESDAALLELYKKRGDLVDRLANRPRKPFRDGYNSRTTEDIELYKKDLTELLEGVDKRIDAHLELRKVQAKNPTNQP